MDAETEHYIAKALRILSTACSERQACVDDERISRLLERPELTAKQVRIQVVATSAKPRGRLPYRPVSPGDPAQQSDLPVVIALVIVQAG